VISVGVRDGAVVVDLSQVDVLFALRKQLVVPLANVTGARIVANAYEIRPRPWLRAPGTAIPGIIRAGTYRSKEGQSFWNIRNGANALVIELHDHRYKRIVLQIADPAAAMEQINAALI